MFSSVSDFLNSAKDAWQDYELLNRTVLNLKIQCSKLENSGCPDDILYATEFHLWRIRKVDKPGVGLVALKKQLESARVCELEALRRAVTQSRIVAEFIEFLPYSDLRVVMRYRYLEGYGWGTISSKMALDGWSITGSYVRTIHSKAMAFAQELWSECNKNVKEGS